MAAHTVTAAYAPAAATVAVARPAPVAVAAAATAAAYGGYPTAHTATDYGYTQRQQEAPPPPPPVTTQNYQVGSCCGVFEKCSERRKPVWKRKCDFVKLLLLQKKHCLALAEMLARCAVNWVMELKRLTSKNFQ